MVLLCKQRSILSCLQQLSLLPCMFGFGVTKKFVQMITDLIGFKEKLGRRINGMELLSVRYIHKIYRMENLTEYLSLLLNAM